MAPESGRCWPREAGMRDGRHGDPPADTLQHCCHNRRRAERPAVSHAVGGGGGGGQRAVDRVGQDRSAVARSRDRGDTGEIQALAVSS